MILSRRVALGGVELDELDESIVIRSVDPGVPHESTGTENRSGGFGSRLTMQHWDSLDVSVKYAIDLPKQEMVRRREVFDMVNAWANGMGWLTTNQMEGRRVWVGKVVTPGGGDMWNWLSEYTIIFRVFGDPFWRDIEPTEVTKKTVTKGNVQIQVGGTAPGVLDISFENVSGRQINDVTFTVDGKDLQLKGVNLAATETLNLTHTAEGYIRLRAVAGNSTRNVYSLLRGADDSYVQPNTLVTVAVDASRAGNLSVKSYARWL